MNARILKCAKLLLRVWCGWFYSRYCSLTLAWFKTIWTAELLFCCPPDLNMVMRQSYSLTVATSAEENLNLDLGCRPILSNIIFITFKLFLPRLGLNNCFIPFNVSLSAGPSNLILDDMERSVFLLLQNVLCPAGLIDSQYHHVSEESLS